MNDESMQTIIRLLTDILEELRLQRNLVEEAGRQRVVVSMPPVNAVSPQRFDLLRGMQSGVLAGTNRPVER